jgi:hypothetical protein
MSTLINDVKESTDILSGYIRREIGSKSVIELFRDNRAPGYGNTVSGYGGKVPTVYRIKFTDNRIRRVYAMIYGNSGSVYVIVNGKDVFLHSDIEHDLMKLEG